MLAPPIQSEQQLAAGREKAEEDFRTRRLTEDAAIYHDLYDVFQGDVADVLELTVDLTKLAENGLEVLSTPRFLFVARFLTGPFTSTDDLKVVAKVDSFKKPALTANPAAVTNVTRVIRETIDRRRFPWLGDGRDADEAEKSQAIMATAVLMATQRVATHRRTKAKADQEAAVEAALLEAKFIKDPAGRIETFSDAPEPGHFCRESELGPREDARKADFVIRLWDNRVMPVECKVSNSATNSIKRLNNDAAQKAIYWHRKFGEGQIVPAAVLSGVYKMKNLIAAQHKSLCIFWEHDLPALLSWIEETRPRRRGRSPA